MMDYLLIKKYPNRRLYDTKSSKYITLVDLKELIITGNSVKVVDSNSDEDLTRGTLLQIIVEAESAGEPIFNTAMLQQIIRFYGGSLQSLFTRYLEENLQLFSRQQTQVRESMNANTMATMVARIAEQNTKLWNDLQDSVFDFSKHSQEPQD